MAEKESKKEIKDQSTYITFLKVVKEGKYAPIEKSSLPYARMKESTIIIEDEYCYGIR